MAPETAAANAYALNFTLGKIIASVKIAFVCTGITYKLSTTRTKVLCIHCSGNQRTFRRSLAGWQQSTRTVGMGAQQCFYGVQKLGTR